VAKLTLNPISASYTFAEPAQTLHQSLPGGMPRQRADMVGGMSRLISATFVCGQTEYEYLVQFVRQNIADDCPQIQIDLLITDSGLLEFNAYIVPDTFALDSIDGITFTCSLQFQVIPLDTESITWPLSWTADTFQLPSDKSSYTVKYGEESISVQYSGNIPKQRRTFFNASRLVSLRWNCNPADYITFFEAYRYWVFNGGKPFYMDLFMDKSVLTRHRCTFVPGSVRLSSHQGHLHVIEVDLEAESTPWPFTYTSHGDGGIGGGAAGDIPSGEGTASDVIAWFDPINDTFSGTLNHANSGTGKVDSYTSPSVTTINAGLVGYIDQTVVWSISWSGSDPSPIISFQNDQYVQIDWVNNDGSSGIIYDASIGVLTVTATVNGTPIAVGQRLLAVSTFVVDYPDLAWGPE